DLPLAVFEVDAIDALVEVGQLALFDRRCAELLGDLRYVTEHGSHPSPEVPPFSMLKIAMIVRRTIGDEWTLPCMTGMPASQALHISARMFADEGLRADVEVAFSLKIGDPDDAALVGNLEASWHVDQFELLRR